jgi:hypothetical protein
MTPPVANLKVKSDMLEVATSGGSIKAISSKKTLANL